MRPFVDLDMRIGRRSTAPFSFSHAATYAEPRGCDQVGRKRFLELQDVQIPLRGFEHIRSERLVSSDRHHTFDGHRVIRRRTARYASSSRDK